MYVPTCIFIILIGLSLAYGQDRKIISTLNPRCIECTNDTILVYTQAIGSKDVIHQIWDFTGVPSVLYAIGSLNSSVRIGWYNKKPTIFTFDKHPSYSFAVAIDKLYEYNDVSDKGAYDPDDHKREIALSGVNWRLTNTTFTDTEAFLKVDGKLDHINGLIEIKLNLVPFSGESSELPHLIHSANSTLVDVRLVNVTTPRTFNSSRLALHLVLVSTDIKTESWNWTMTKTLDDEHTPGVFEIIELQSPQESQLGSGGFLQFRPVAYTEPARDVSSSTNAYFYGFNSSSLPRSGILQKFYQHYDAELLVQDAIVSFGISGDGFYTQHNFTSWSFTFGYGTPPAESFSLLVFIVIVVSSAILCSLLLTGLGILIYQLVRRYRRQHTSLYDDSE